MTTPIPGDFRARLGGRVFTDRHEFEKATKTFLGLSRHLYAFALGDLVYFDYADRPVVADVWADGPNAGSYWVRGDDGVTYLIGKKVRGRRFIQPCTNQGSAIGDDRVRELRSAA